jgi:hypothetical protein
MIVLVYVLVLLFWMNVVYVMVVALSTFVQMNH